MSAFKILDTFNTWLDKYLNFEKLPQKNIFWLDTMEFLCEKLGNPQNKYKTIHVAGSKGKGSTSVMIAGILQEAGFNCGLYSSPHIIDFAERIGKPDGPFSQEVYEKSVKEVMDTVDALDSETLPLKRPITWFELVTVFAFVCFKNAGVDYAVIEVGLGGRLDATNVISPVCCCITPIEKEHTEYLGDTEELIAKEKGGIIKENVPVLISAQKDSVRKVFEEIAETRNSPVTFIGDTSKVSQIVYKSAQKPQMEVTLLSPLFKRPLNCTLKLMGKYQCYNALLSCMCVKTIMPQLDESVMEAALSKASLTGRFEVYEEIPAYKGIKALILDGAHTVNSVSYTMETLADLYPEEKNIHLLFGCALDKDIKDISLLFKNRFTSVTVTKPGLIKQSSLSKMEEAFRENQIEFKSFEDFTQGIKTSLQKASEEKSILLVTGSFYLVSEVLKFLKNL